jgi:hypothetical protein
LEARSVGNGGVSERERLPDGWGPSGKGLPEGAKREGMPVPVGKPTPNPPLPDEKTAPGLANDIGSGALRL